MSRPSCLGIDVAGLRFKAFILSAVYGGAAGALMAHVIRVVSPENLELSLMVTCLTMTVIGGSTRIAGAIVGAILIVYLREWFRILENFYPMAYGAATLVILILAPYGLVGAVERIRERLIPDRGVAPPSAAPLDLGKSMLGPRDGELLAVGDVSKSFGGVRALDGVGLALDAGEVVGLIGPNGSGKTTFLNIMSGLYRPDAGSLTFLGRDITGSPPVLIARLGIARTFQHIDLVDDLTVLDNIAVARAHIERANLWHSILAVGPDSGFTRPERRPCRHRKCSGIGDVVMTRCGAFPTARGAEWKSRARWRRRRDYCCSTSRPPD